MSTFITSSPALRKTYCFAAVTVPITAACAPRATSGNENSSL
jgi:hypothetical protein